MKKSTISSGLLNATLSKKDPHLYIASKLYRAIDTPTSLGLYLCLRHGDLLSIVKHTVDPLNYVDADSYAADLQATKFLSKCAFKIEGVNPDESARDAFLGAEEKCRTENLFWYGVLNGSTVLTKEIDSSLAEARRFIAETLGDFDVTAWLDECRFGPGVVAFGPRGTDLHDKLSSTPAVTQEFAAFAPAFLNEFEGWVSAITYGYGSKPNPIVVQGGKFALVPKKATIDRDVETQPIINSFAQLGIGSLIRARLKNIGIDLNTCSSMNQARAKVGSVTGRLATIDMRMASNLISDGIIRFLLPERWYNALDAVRTHRIQYDGVWLPLNRFASMGNGFCFELESLIFLAIARSLTGDVSIFGDDLIVPSNRALAVMRLLEFCGFEINREKSYWSGPFRESCGKDYFLGQNVRPYYLKEVPSSVEKVIRVANGLTRCTAGRDNCTRHYQRYRGVVADTLNLIPVEIRRGLAIGWSAGDEILLGYPYRDGWMLIPSNPTREYTAYYPAKGRLLYQAWKNEQRIPLLTDRLTGRYLARAFQGISGKQESDGVIRKSSFRGEYRLEQTNILSQYHHFGAPPGVPDYWVLQQLVTPR